MKLRLFNFGVTLTVCSFWWNHLTVMLTHIHKLKTSITYIYIYTHIYIILCSCTGFTLKNLNYVANIMLYTCKVISSVQWGLCSSSYCTCNSMKTLELTAGITSCNLICNLPLPWHTNMFSCNKILYYCVLSMYVTRHEKIRLICAHKIWPLLGFWRFITLWPNIVY